MVLIDTASWIHFLRPDGGGVVRGRVDSALSHGEACWCPLVRLELWNGASRKKEQRILEEFERVIPELPVDSDVWQCSIDPARNARVRGVTVPATDILIAACARHHGVAIGTADSDFGMIAAIA